MILDSLTVATIIAAVAIAVYVVGALWPQREEHHFDGLLADFHRDHAHLPFERRQAVLRLRLSMARVRRVASLQTLAAPGESTTIIAEAIEAEVSMLLVHDRALAEEFSKWAGAASRREILYPAAIEAADKMERARRRHVAAHPDLIAALKTRRS